MGVRRKLVNSGTHLQVSRPIRTSVLPSLRSISALCLDNEVFEDDRAVFIGVSPDSVDEQKLFVEKHKLTVSALSKRTLAAADLRFCSTYPVLSDEKLEARKAYNIGKGMLGLTDYARTTYVIDKKG